MPPADRTLGPVLQPPLAPVFPADSLHTRPCLVLSVLWIPTNLNTRVKYLQAPCHYFKYNISPLAAAVQQRFMMETQPETCSLPLRRSRGTLLFAGEHFMEGANTSAAIVVQAALSHTPDVSGVR